MDNDSVDFKWIKVYNTKYRIRDGWKSEKLQGGEGKGRGLTIITLLNIIQRKKGVKLGVLG